MTQAEIVSRLSRLIDNPTSDVLYSITMQQVIQLIAYRMEEDSLSLSVDDLNLARDEVKEAIDHHLDIREYISIGLDSWEIVRKL